jgi:hypothetical protein
MHLWREAQQYRPNKYFATLSLYLEGVYIPHPEDTSSFTADGDLFETATYKSPKFGVDPYSKAAADWQHARNGYTLNNIVAVIPLDKFTGMKNGLVLAASYNDTKILDFDRNDTYLDPNPGYSFYGDISAVGTTPDTIHWWRYNRQREGLQHQVNIGLGLDVLPNLKVGIKANMMWCTTTDDLGLRRYATFILYDQNDFAFKYENEVDTTVGTSKFKSLSFTVGLQYTLSKLTIGLQVTSPTTITRDLSYVKTISYSGKVNSTQVVSGTDKLKLPVAFAIGISYTPIKKVTIAADVQNVPYASSDFEFSQPDKYFQKWVNQNIFRIGLEYRPYQFLSFALGYRNIPEAYVPDGAAIRDSGPVCTSYSCGVGVTTKWGRVDLAYEMRQLKYYDSYFSNTNYNTELSDNILLSYRINF